MNTTGNNLDLSCGRNNTRLLLKKLGLKANKGFGQHFLVDKKALKYIIAASDLTKQDTVIEVGPGLGVLTTELSNLAGQVISVEIDNGLARQLENNLPTGSNIRVINRDILETRPQDLLDEGTSGYKVVANLPYYITSPVLRHFLEADLPPELMVVMVQKEVARVITARPGDMSLLSVGVQAYGSASIVANVPAGSFHPVPRVDSSIVRIVSHSQPLLTASNRQSFFRIVRAGFCSPRKQLVNTLSHGLGLDKKLVLQILQKANVIPQDRPERLSVADWYRIWQVIITEGEWLCSL